MKYVKKILEKEVKKMNNIGTVNLETERLLLRKGTISDANQVYENYGKDPLVSKYVVWNQHLSVEDAVKLMEKWQESYESKASYKWLVIEKNSQKIIGSITAVKVDEKNKTVAIGYCYGSKWWNKGYATETLKRVIKFFFEEVGVETIYANHLTSNIASGKVMKKAGMIFEGTLRNRMIDKITNKPMGLETYSITKEDYYN